MKKKLLPLVLSFVSIGAAHSQKVNYLTEMQQLQTAIRQNFYRADINYYKEFPDSSDKHKVCYLWSMAALWQADNETDKSEGTNFTLDDKHIINKYFDPSPPAAGYASYPPEFGKEDRYYDDNQWLGLTAADAWFRTNDSLYLKTATDIYRFMMTGFDTVYGGGLYWKENDKSTKNTCSNGPGIVLALELYKAVKDKKYLETALRLYRWVNAHLQDKDGLYFDNINVLKNHIGDYKFSYNTGTMLQANALLYILTHNKKYLNEAVRISDAAVKYFLSSGKFRDNYWFNAVYLRGIIELYNINRDNKPLLAFAKCLDDALQNNMNEQGLAGKPKAMNLVAQGGLSEMVARYAYLYQKGILQ